MNACLTAARVSKQKPAQMPFLSEAFHGDVRHHEILQCIDWLVVSSLPSLVELRLRQALHRLQGSAASSHSS